MTADVVVVGAGPNGLAVHKALCDRGLSVLAVDQAGICHHLEGFPAGMVFFSTAEKLTLDETPMGDGEGTNPTLEMALAYYRDFAARHNLRVEGDRRLVGIEGEDGAFRLHFAAGEPIAARKVVLATGIYSQPNLLGVPGEDDPAVSHYYPGAAGISGQRVLLVGGGNTAAEAALDLMGGNEVILSYRGPAPNDRRVKPWVLPDLEAALAGPVRGVMQSTVTSLTGGVARFDTPAGEVEAPFDSAYILTGYGPDRALLERVGLTLEGAKDIPVHDPATLESTKPGIYVAGALLAGGDAHRVFIENGRLHGAPIAAHVQASLAAGP